MKIGKVTAVILCLLSVFLSCNKDDDGGGIPEPTQRDRTEQQAADKDSLTDYLQNHYYNSSAFVSNPDPSLADLVVSELPEDGVLPDPDNNTLLIDAVETHTTIFADTDYEYYILRLNQGDGAESPHFSDDVRVNYSGNTLDDEVFDSSVNPVEFDLYATGIIQIIPGWRKVLPKFNVAESFIENGDGTIDYMNHGLGVMYLPSGLAYFA
ncbi:MAG TPA: FKBP-type peptidyl-prolyl cis-trans isomerase, partial [Flavobacteriaceae bacterium]|nr:FKBP-type peptidyl-prolyl cis-trans isomerase [Flavobacteriaceae bacterium]